MPTEDFVRVASVPEVPAGSLKTVHVKGEDVVLANSGGKLYAIGAICNHKQWDLSEGRLEGDVIVCAGHGARWNTRTGEGQFTRPLPPEPVYQVKVSEGAILVRPGK